MTSQRQLVNEIDRSDLGFVWHRLFLVIGIHGRRDYISSIISMEIYDFEGVLDLGIPFNFHQKITAWLFPDVFHSASVSITDRPHDEWTEGNQRSGISRVQVYVLSFLESDSVHILVTAPLLQPRKGAGGWELVMLLGPISIQGSNLPYSNTFFIKFTFD